MLQKCNGKGVRKGDVWSDNPLEFDMLQNFIICVKEFISFRIHFLVNLST